MRSICRITRNKYHDTSFFFSHASSILSSTEDVFPSFTSSSKTMLQFPGDFRAVPPVQTVCPPRPGLLRVAQRPVVLPGRHPPDHQPVRGGGVLCRLWQQERGADQQPEVPQVGPTSSLVPKNIWQCFDFKAFVGMCLFALQVVLLGSSSASSSGLTGWDPTSCCESWSR